VKPILVTSGEPAGIGPDLCLFLADKNWPVVILCDKDILVDRAQQLNLDVKLIDYRQDSSLTFRPHQLHVISLPCASNVIAGQLDAQNAAYVIQMLTQASQYCLENTFSALVTAPIHKSVINQAGIIFTGHTEFFADFCGGADVVMMLVCEAMRVALVTTHLPLNKVPAHITVEKIKTVVCAVAKGLQQYSNILQPKLAVAGLNPHAGEDGYLGTEEIEIINPTILDLQVQGLDVSGAFPADTMFTPSNLALYDAFIAMYHDQGLPVLKHAGFGQAVNVTLGLPFIRTSVDHGTALDLAGTGQASPESLFCAIKLAIKMARACQK
jgi:4-hydroxythreonine-4-phosphate dehydrogenase